MRVTAFLVIIHALESNGELTASEAHQLFTDFSSVNGNTVVDIAFDVNCNENSDRFCYDYCMYYCALKSATPEKCRTSLPPGCTATFGGMRAVKSVWLQKDGPWRNDEPEITNIWQMDLKQLHANVVDILQDHNVDFADLYMGVAPKEEEQTWLDEGQGEDAIDEGDLFKNLCNSDGSVIGGSTVTFNALDPEGALKEFAGAVERRGIQPRGLFVAKRGWKLFQQYVGHWENELLKRFMMIPMSRDFIVNDQLFVTQFAKAKRTLVGFQGLEGCLTEIPSEAVPVVYFFIWGRRVQGDRIPSLAATNNYASSIDEWGYPQPRASESCATGKDCPSCAKLSRTDGQRCQWCLTSYGQSCQAECNDGFHYPLECQSNRAYRHLVFGGLFLMMYYLV